MNKKIESLVKELRLVLIESSTDTTTTANIFFNCQGYKIDLSQRSPESLKREGISMRNLKGDFIK